MVGGEGEGVADDPVVPAHDADDEVEEVPRVATGEDDGDPCGDGCEDDADVEDEQDEVVRDGEEPLGQRHPTVEVGADVGVRDARGGPIALRRSTGTRRAAAGGSSSPGCRSAGRRG